MITSTHTVCVVIPIYQAKLQPFEQVALERCIAVLGSHPVAVVKPESLCLDALYTRHPQLLSENFPDHYFDGIQGYNRLMLADELYARFAAYEFILIHQLDAFVFSDQLLHWCSRGYDYIGAPWLPPGQAPNMRRQALATIRRRIYRLFDILNDHSGHTHDPQISYSIGNGGFSLRRVSRMRQALATFHDRAEPYRCGTRRTWAEDLFFSVEANRYRRYMRTPTIQEAAQFSWETSPAVAAQLSNVPLPFGCHAWNKLHRTEWRPVFASLGYSIDNLLETE